jgi:alpha-amylase/alpha-mannosidase (GH57 family)
LEGQAARPLPEEEQQRLWKLLELQRQSQLMYTSCGWFFDDLGGIEAMLVLRHAARAVRLAEELFGVPLEGRFLELLSEAKSNDPAVGDGRRIYETL